MKLQYHCLNGELGSKKKLLHGETASLTYSPRVYWSTIKISIATVHNAMMTSKILSNNHTRKWRHAWETPLKNPMKPEVIIVDVWIFCSTTGPQDRLLAITDELSLMPEFDPYGASIGGLTVLSPSPYVKSRSCHREGLTWSLLVMTMCSVFQRAVGHQIIFCLHHLHWIWIIIIVPNHLWLYVCLR